MLVFLVCRICYLLVANKVERSKLRVFRTKPVAGNVKLLALLNLAHGAENFVVLNLNLLEVRLSERILILRVNRSLLSLFL